MASRHQLNELRRRLGRCAMPEVTARKDRTFGDICATVLFRTERDRERWGDYVAKVASEMGATASDSLVIPEAIVVVFQSATRGVYSPCQLLGGVVLGAAFLLSVGYLVVSA